MWIGFICFRTGVSETSCEHGKEHVDSIKDGGRLEKLAGYKLYKNDSAGCNSFVSCNMKFLSMYK
jgi:hypothetical protein